MKEPRENQPGFIRVLNTGRSATAETTRKVLADLLARAERGEVLSVFGVIETTDGGYENFGSSTMSRLQTAGALLDSAISRLGYRFDDQD